MNTPTPLSTVAGTSNRAAKCAAGTVTFVPVNRYPSPSAVAVVEGIIGVR
jgi:hypothetical protein